MELFALFIVVIGVSCAQDVPVPPLRVAFENSAAREVSTDQHLIFVCHINRDVMYALVNFVEFVRLPAVDSAQEVILTQAAKRVHAEPAFYNVKVTPSAENTIRVEFEIVKTRDLDEGHLMCRVRPSEDNPDGEKAEAQVEITIMRPLDALYLKFGNLDAISVSTKDPIEVDSGKHTVQCTAEGSNPAPAKVHLYLHGTEVESVAITDKMNTAVTKWRTVITGELELKVSNSNQEIECSAASKLGDSRSVKLPIKMKVYDPKIVCNDSEAVVGQWYPVLTCIVDYEGLSIKSFKYELGKDAIQEGTQNKDFVEVKREQLSDTQARVVLNLYQAKRWHFSTEFYLVVEHEDGHITRETVRLHEQPGNVTVGGSEKGRGASRGSGGGNSCGLLSASVATLVMSVWCAYQLTL